MQIIRYIDQKFVFKRLKGFFQKLDIHFLFLLEIIFSRMSQSRINSFFSILSFYFFVVIVFWFNNNVFCLIVLSITMNIVLYFSDRIKIKYMTTIRNESVEINIDIIFSYETCFFIWLKSQIKQCLIYCFNFLNNFE